MKIAIGFDIKENSWGGGNQFALSLAKEAISKGFQITHNLKDRDIDIILLTDPRSYNEGVTFGSLEILKYLLFKNKNAIVVHRINECDERKNTKHINQFLKWANYCSDYTVFISSWLKKLDTYQRNKPFKVILNGGDKKIFFPYEDNTWDGIKPLKLVTHHWSPNYMKGFDVYRDIDELLNNDEYRNKIEFTYIGNLPKGFKFKNTKHIKPINGHSLGLELSKNHIYISGSLNEPAGMHHIEGALCGLPLIYRNSGALPEYCSEYGIPFENSDYLPALEMMMKNYNKYKSKIKKYPNNSIKMTDEYLELFNELIKNRQQIIMNRRIFQSPIILIKNFIFLILRLKNTIKFIRNKFF